MLDMLLIRDSFKNSKVNRLFNGVKEWFDKTVLVEFEGRKYAAPVQYDEYLKMQYGNYMQLPPEEKRISHDMHAYWVGNVTK